jgi:hypothetical protein
MQTSRLSISQSRRRSVLWRVFEVKCLQYIAFKIVSAKSVLPLLQFRYDMMNAEAQTGPASSEELRAEIDELPSTDARRQEQASCLVEGCAELQDIISCGTSMPPKS